MSGCTVSPIMRPSRPAPPTTRSTVATVETVVAASVIFVVTLKS